MRSAKFFHDPDGPMPSAGAAYRNGHILLSFLREPRQEQA